MKWEYFKRPYNSYFQYFRRNCNNTTMTLIRGEWRVAYTVTYRHDDIIITEEEMLIESIV